MAEIIRYTLGTSVSTAGMRLLTTDLSKRNRKREAELKLLSNYLPLFICTYAYS